MDWPWLSPVVYGCARRWLSVAPVNSSHPPACQDLSIVHSWLHQSPMSEARPAPGHSAGRHSAWHSCCSVAEGHPSCHEVPGQRPEMSSLDTVASRSIEHHEPCSADWRCHHAASVTHSSYTLTLDFTFMKCSPLPHVPLLRHILVQCVSPKAITCHVLLHWLTKPHTATVVHNHL